jgi:hypothetical protein
MQDMAFVGDAKAGMEVVVTKMGKLILAGKGVEVTEVMLGHEA